MCFRNKWKDFEPNQKYLSIVSGLTSVSKLYNYLKQFKWQGEKGWRDYWKTPLEFIENKDKDNDCEDFARFAVDVLVRIIGIDDTRFIVHCGYNKERWGNKKYCHAICVFPYQGKLAVFNNQQFKTGFENHIETGHLTFPDGLKSQVIRDWQGKVLKRRYQLFGTF